LPICPPSSGGVVRDRVGIWHPRQSHALIRFERSDRRRLGFAICVEGKSPSL
jgi:hypothetical protein